MGRDHHVPTLPEDSAQNHYRLKRNVRSKHKQCLNNQKFSDEYLSRSVLLEATVAVVVTAVDSVHIAWTTDPKERRRVGAISKVSRKQRGWQNGRCNRDAAAVEAAAIHGHRGYVSDGARATVPTRMPPNRLARAGRGGRQRNFTSVRQTVWKSKI